MTLQQILEWALLPALAGVAWIARSVSRIEARMDVLEKDKAELWRHVNAHTGGISDVREDVANIKGRLST